MYDVVDKDDQVIGKASRQECHAKGLIHRAVQIVIMNSQGDFLLQKRSMNADTFPGLLTSTAAGHVASGETYEEAAPRELKEEAGVDVPLERIGMIRSYEKEHMQHAMVFLGRSDGPFTREEKEIDDLSFFTMDQLKTMEEQFTPAFREVFKLIKTQN